MLQGSNCYGVAFSIVSKCYGVFSLDKLYIISVSKTV